MMLGAFTTYMFVVWYGVGYWAAFALAVAIVGLFGAAARLDRAPARAGPAAVRRGHADDRAGRDLPELRLDHLGLGDLHAAHAVQRQGHPGGRGHREPRVRLDHRRHVGAVRRALSCSSGAPGVGVAMQAASQNQLAAYYMGIPVKRMFSLIWAISAGVAAIAGVLLAPVSLIDINLGFIGLKAFAAAVLGGFGSIPGALVGGITIGADRAVLRHLPAARIQGRRGLRGAAAGAGDAAAGHVRQRRPEEGLTRRALRLQDRVRAGPGAVPRRRPAQLVRGAAGRAARAAPLVPAYRRRPQPRLHLRPVRALAHGAGRLHRASSAWATRPSSASAPTRTSTSRRARACRGSSAWRWPAALTAGVGVLVGLPALRMTGVYLTIATLAFALIIQEVFARWERVTGGLKGTRGGQAGDLRREDGRRGRRSTSCAWPSWPAGSG